MDTSNIERRLRFLSMYAVCSSVVILFMIISAFRLVVGISAYKDATPLRSDTLHIRHLTAERVDIIEPDGNLAIALSNSVTSAKPQFDGQILHGASNRDIPNIIFFDGKGDEVGGLAFANFQEDDSPFQAIRHLAFDGYRQDEVITLSHFLQNGKSRKGVYIYDRPDVTIIDAFKEAGIDPEDTPDILGKKLDLYKTQNPDRYQELWGNPRRVALQTNEYKDAQLLLADSEGNTRLRFVVKSGGEAFIEFLDKDENVVKRLLPQ